MVIGLIENGFQEHSFWVGADWNQENVQLAEIIVFEPENPLQSAEFPWSPEQKREWPTPSEFHSGWEFFRFDQLNFHSLLRSA